MNTEFAKIYIRSLKTLLAMCAIISVVGIVLLACGYIDERIYLLINNDYISFPIFITLDALIIALMMSVADWLFN